ncbi:MAG: hypothetical protein M9962_01885 [Oligoflexia bacterium]|nr:hypothetical protein [Oligoflexia bacterium]
MIRKWVAGFALLLAPVVAKADCMDLSGHYVLVTKEYNSLIRLTQKSCDKVNYAVMAIRGDKVKPIASIDYKSGEGFKPLPGDLGTEYELSLGKESGIIRMKKSGSDGTICMDTITFTRDPYMNLTGQYNRFCNDFSAPQSWSITFHRL